MGAASGSHEPADNQNIRKLKTNSAGLGLVIPISKLSKVLRTANLDQVMMKEALNENRIYYRGSDKLCTVRGMLRFYKNKQVLNAQNHLKCPEKGFKAFF